MKYVPLRHYYAYVTFLITKTSFLKNRRKMLVYVLHSGGQLNYYVDVISHGPTHARYLCWRDAIYHTALGGDA